MKQALRELHETFLVEATHEAFAVFATHQVDGERTNTGPHVEYASGPNAHDTIRDWLQEDPKVVDYYIRPATKEERQGNPSPQARRMADTLISYFNLTDRIED